ncbi:MAG: thioredoxin domain-containing protein [Thiotrichales bacterium]|nr:thioredoxin domain-containing protein [Thiotrichales bacterium]
MARSINPKHFEWRRLFWTLLLVWTPAAASQAHFDSELHQHPSQYLAMHADDPVKWLLWQPSSLRQAQRYNKLILVSSGYFSCHWCHVMQQEVYQNTQTADQLNQRFISIKVDRELNPQLDQQMIAFAKTYRGAAGWPQHLILTPQGLPLAAFTYLPNEGLQRLLTAVDKLWKENRPQLIALAETAIPVKNQELIKWDIQKFKKALYQQLPEQIDDLSGGLAGSHKFPKTPLLLSLVQQTDLPSDLTEWLKLTLQKMQSEALFDPVYGGFYRYTVDPEWQTPHFEKMLYDNAQLLELYLLADLRWPNQGFAQTAEQTLAYLRTQLYSPTLKLYLGSQSAVDHEGREGGGYLFDREQLQQVLSEKNFNQLQKSPGFPTSPPFDLGYLPRSDWPNWRQIRPLLRKARSNPPMPVDSKAVFGWNGLMLQALVTANRWQRQQTQRTQTPYLAQSADYAQELTTALLSYSRNLEIPRALNATPQGEPISAPATLADLSYVWRGLQRWMRQEGIQLDLSTLRQAILAQAKDQGWQSSPNLLLYPQVDWVMAEDAEPSSTAQLGCDFGPIQIDQNHFYTQALNYASYLTLARCR